MHTASAHVSTLPAARALVIGVGGLGAPAAMALAAAGVGTIGLMDPDVVDISNLPRQPLYDDEDIGRPKAVVAAERLAAAHPGIEVVPVVARFAAGDARTLRGWDVVVDGTDTVAAKFVVSDAAVAAAIPLVHAGAIGFRAQLLTVLPGSSACYRCLFEEPPPPGETPSCEDAGVLAPVVHLAGTLQAAEAVRLIAGEPAAFAGRLLAVDLLAGTWRSIPVPRRPDCAACGAPADLHAVGRSVSR